MVEQILPPREVNSARYYSLIQPQLFPPEMKNALSAHEAGFATFSEAVKSRIAQLPKKANTARYQGISRLLQFIGSTLSVDDIVA